MAALTTTAGIPKYDVWRPSPSFTAIQNLSELALQGAEFNVSNRRQWSGNFHGIEIVGLSGIGKSTLTKYLFNGKISYYHRSYFIYDAIGDALQSRKNNLGKRSLPFYDSYSQHYSNYMMGEVNAHTIIGSDSLNVDEETNA